jgi:hypothetical protein
MPGLCGAPGCDSPTTSRYSVYCSRHQSRLRRQGDVAQKAISEAELKTYLKRVRQRIARNPDSPAWGQLEARWLTVVEHANGVLAAEKVRRAAFATRAVRREVVTLGDAVSAREGCALAMFVIWRWSRASSVPTMRSPCSWCGGYDGSLMPTRPTTSTPSPTRVSASIATLAEGQPRSLAASWQGRGVDPWLL